MNKLKLIELVKSRCGVTQSTATDFVNHFFNEMAQALAAGERVELRGLWSFHLKAYQSYIGRNPKTGDVVTIAAKKLPFFKCGKALRERADYPPN